MKIIMELSQLEQLKNDMCDKRCRFLHNANSIKAKNAMELRKVTEQMEKICAECPLNRLP